MAVTVPQAGQVIRYAYLWWNESRAGREHGAKDRPCGVVLTRVTSAGNTIAYVLPVRPTPPLKDERGIEIPQATKRHLGLDAERLWIITTELNLFAWPGPDIRPTHSGEYLYGYVPEKLMRLVLDQVKRHARDKQLRTVPRTEQRCAPVREKTPDAPPDTLSSTNTLTRSRRW